MSRLLVAVVISLTSCVASDVRTRSALDALAEVVDPAWSLAESACMQAQMVVAARERAGLFKPLETDASLLSIRERCDIITGLFERIRAEHMEARTRLSRGDVYGANELLQGIRAHWRALQGAYEP